MFVVGCCLKCLILACCWLFVVCQLLVFHCLLIVVCCSLLCFAVCCSQVVGRCSLFVAGCVLIACRVWLCFSCGCL